MSTKKQIANLAKLKLNELQAKYVEIIGKETRSHNKTFLTRKITEALQTQDGIETASPGASTVTETAVTASTTATTAPVPEKVVEKLAKLTVPELQARYLEEVGRSTGSSNKAYVELANMGSRKRAAA